MKNAYRVEGQLAYIALNHRGESVECVVDRSDLTIADSFKGSWCAVRYTKSRTLYVVATDHNKGNRISLKLHRLITEAKEGEIVDHENMNGLDNRRSNLRLCDPLLNAQNTRVISSNSSGYRGVSYKADKRKWRAYYTTDRKQVHVGYFSSKEDAHIAVSKARAEMMPYSADALRWE